MSDFLKLGEHCVKIGSGSTPRGGHKSYVANGIPLIRSQNVLMRSFTRDGLARITAETHEEMAGTEVRPGDVLLNITGASIGRVCVVPGEICPANVNQHVCIIRCGKKIDPQFLMLYLSSPAFQKLIDDTQAGGTRQALTKSDIENFEIPAFDIEKQRFLSISITTKLSHLESARVAASVQTSDLEILPHKLLSQALEGCPLVPLTEAAVIHDYLREPVSSAVRAKRGGKFPYFGATGQVGWIDDFKQDGTYVLLGEDGAPFFDKKKAKAYMVHGKCWVNNHAHVLKAKAGHFNDEFLCHALNWADYREAVSGSTRLKLPQNTMNKVLIPAPPLDEQVLVASKLNAAVTATNNAREAVLNQCSEIDALSRKLLAQAFES